MNALQVKPGLAPDGRPDRKPEATPIEEGWGLWALLAIPVFLTVITLLWAEGSPKTYEAPQLRLALTFVFMTLVSLFVAYLAARIFLAHGRVALLLFGCGGLFWAAAGLVAVTVGQGDINLAATIHNSCAGFSAVCHLAAVTLSLWARRECRRPRLWLSAAYAASLGIASLITLSAIQQWTPLFFVQGKGGTPVRQILLGAASTLFLLAAMTLVLTSRRRVSGFRGWYAAALALIGIGLFGVMLQPAAGTALSWAGRAAQYLGGAYLLVAAVVSAREFRAWGIPVEEALRESEQRFRALFEHMSEGFAVHEIICNNRGEPCDYRFLEVNPAFERLTGLRREDVVGKTISVVLPKSEPEWVATYGQVALTGEPVHFERFSAPLARYYEVFAYRPAPGQFACVFLDITARKKATAEIEAEQLRLAMALEAGGMVTWEWDIASGTVRYSNNISAIVRGEAAEPYCSLASLLPQIHPEDRDRLTRALDQTAQTGSPFECEYRVRMLDGVYRWILGKGKTVVVESGKPVRVLGLSMEINERKEAEEKLRRSEALYRAIGESIEFGVWVCAPDGRNIYASDSFLKLVGQTQEQCSNFGWGDVLHPEDAERTIAAWKQCVQTEGKWDIEHRFRGVDGQWHDILARGVPVRDEKGQIVCWAGINLDISRLKRTEQALQEAQARLQAHADELEKIVARRTARLQETISELEHFSYAITHDLRAPLRAMQGFAEMIDEECATCDRPLSRQYLRRIKTASSRMDQLISDSLSYSKASRQELPLSEVDLNELLIGMVETYPNLQPDKADIHIEPGLPLVFGNEAALTQCFSNLLGNAVKFVRPGLKPQIRIWGEPAGSRRSGRSPTPRPHDPQPPSAHGNQVPADQDSRPPTAFVRIWVEDNGIGIPENYLDRIFGIFQRGSNEYEGTGIGLAIVRKVVNRMGGQVGVESELDKGSRFWVELPTLRVLP